MVVDVDQTDQMRDFVAGGINALVLSQEADAGNAEAMNFLLLLGRDFALQPDEAFFRRQPLAHFAGIEIRQRCGQKLDRFILVDDPARLAEQTRRLDVRGEHFAVAINDVRPCGGDGVLRRGPTRGVIVSAKGEHDQAPADHRIDRRKCQHRKTDAGARFGGAIHIAPVQHAADQSLPPWFCTFNDFERPIGHC